MNNDLEIMPFSEVLFSTSPASAINKTDYIVEGLNALPQRYSLILASALLRGDGLREVPCRILNPTATKVKLRKGTRITKVYEIAEVTVPTEKSLNENKPIVFNIDESDLNEQQLSD